MKIELRQERFDRNKVESPRALLAQRLPSARPPGRMWSEQFLLESPLPSCERQGG